MDTPRYGHDCTDCVFLGQFNKYDLYFCPREPTIIARYSTEGSEYTSGIVFGITSDEVRPGEGHPLRECLIRALMIPDFRAVINEHVILREFSFPERVEWYREVIKLADERIQCRNEILKLGETEPLSTTHTSSPWEVRPSSNRKNGSRWRDIVSVGTEFSPSYVGECLDRDAPLISSAPDMLEALQYTESFVRLARQYFPKSIRNPDKFQLENTCACIGKALNKATGK